MSGLKRALRTLGILLALCLGGWSMLWLSAAAVSSSHEIPDFSKTATEGWGPRLRYDGSELRANRAFRRPEPGESRWLVWLSRDPFEGLRVQGPDWAPAANAYVSQQRDVVHAAPSPRVMSERPRLSRMARDAALAYAVYAALATLAIAALALYTAVRDAAFLMYAGYALLALLFGATVNGHLYGLPGIGLLGRLGASGLSATVVLLFAGSGLYTLVRYAGLPSGPWCEWPRRLALCLLVVALLLPLLSAALPGLRQPVATIGLGLALVAGLAVAGDAARRGVARAGTVLAALLLLAIAAGAYLLMQSGRLPDTLWTRYGYQLALVMLSVVVYVGLCSRIGQVRRRLDDEASARRDSEQRLRHEQGRGNFARALQTALRGAPDDAIATTAFRLLGQHASAQLGSADVVVVAEGYAGHERLLVQAMAGPAATADAVRPALAVVRQHAVRGIPGQVRLEAERGSGARSTRLYAIVPLPLPAPAWAALVAPLPHDRGPAPEVLALLGELAAVAVRQVEEAEVTLQLRRSAEHDALTGSLNRRALDQLLARALHRSDDIVSVLFIDIDWFKRINDTHGHACGDHCLRSIAATLRAELRPGDALGRYGGEEFLVVLPGQDAAAARVLGERLRRTVEHTPVLWRGELLALTVSIGLGTRERGELDAATLLERADKALYLAKHDGRNCVRAAAALT